MSHDLPSSWTLATLGELVSYGSAQKVTPAQIETDAWVLELEDIEKDTSRILQRLTFAERQSKSTKARFSAGDILYGKLRPYLNKIVLADEGGYCTTEIVPITAPLGIDARYLFYAMKRPAFLEYVESVSHGLNMPRLGTKAANEAVIPLAPSSEQKRIADKLDQLLAAVDACKAHLDAVSAILKRFRQSVLAAAISGELTEDWRAEDRSGAAQESGDELVERWVSARRARFSAEARRGGFKEPVLPDLSNWDEVLPPSWTVASVSQFSECLDSLRVPVKKADRSRAKGTYPYYGANGLVDWVDDYIFDDELVLVTEDETFYGREKPIAYRVSGKCWVNNHAHVLRPETPESADYLCFALMYYNVLPWLTGTTGRAKLTQAALNALPIAVPPLAEQREIVRRVEALFTVADQLEAKLATARARVDKLTQSLLAKAFRGELVPQDPDDEPAEALLARIRAETGRQAPARRRTRKAAESGTA